MLDKNRDETALVKAQSAAPSAKKSEPVDTLAGLENGARPVSLDFLQPSDRPGVLGRLDHYEVLEVLGQGAFGVVLKARDEKLQRLVAVKVLAPQLAQNDAARRRFVREARAGAAVRDVHVVKIYDAQESPVPYLVMEYVSGPTLHDRIAETGPLPVLDVVHIGTQVAEGLVAAHRQGEVHRDIKPGNILLETRRESRVEGREAQAAEDLALVSGLSTLDSTRVKITDFGLARAVDDASLTQSGIVAGTPMYMSPEQARAEPVDQRSDLFSLGSVLYTMCTGDVPFKAATSLGVMKRVCDDTPQPIHEVNPAVPGWLSAIIRKLMAKDAAERFQTAAEVAGLLRQHLAHLRDPSLPAPPPLDEGPQTLVSRPHKQTAPRQEALVSRCRLVAVLSVIGIALVITLAPHLLGPEAVEHASAPRSEANVRAELRQIALEHEAAAKDLVRSNRLAEAWARLDEGMTAVEKASVGAPARRVLALELFRQRAQVARRLGKLDEADADLRQVRLLLEELYAQDPADADLADNLARLVWDEATWLVIRPVGLHALAANLRLLPDGSILASGANSNGDVYTLELAGLPPAVAALRLEFLTHPSLPMNGPGRHPSGNFQLTEVVVHARTADQRARGVAIAQGAASFAFGSERIEHAFDNNRHSIWHVFTRTGQNHWANFQFAEPVRLGADDRLVIRLEHSTREPPGINLGRFRLLASGSAAAVAADTLRARFRGQAALGAAYFYHGDFARAVGPLSQALEGRKNPGAIELLLSALAHQALGQQEPARSRYNLALRRLTPEPADSTLALLLRRAVIEIDRLGPLEADTRLAALADARELAALTAVVDKASDKADAYVKRASWFASRGRWQDCARDYRDCIEVDLTASLEWQRAAGALVMAGDVDGYHRLRRRLADTLKGVNDIHTADRATKMWLLLPGYDDQAKFLHRAHDGHVSRIADTHPHMVFAGATQALAAYRAGDHARAILWSNKAIGKDPRGPGVYRAFPALAFLVRAMAEHHLARHEAARRSFAEAADLIPDALQRVGPGDQSGKVRVDPAVVGYDFINAGIWRREAEELLFPTLAAYLAGKRQPAANDERLGLAFACRARRDFAAAADLYAEAFSADPKLAADPKAAHRYAAACCAARAAWAAPDDPASARLRQLALDWLRADLAVQAQCLTTGTARERAQAKQALGRWLRDPELAGVRDALAIVPAQEREAWSMFWRAVADVGVTTK